MSITDKQFHVLKEFALAKPRDILPRIPHTNLRTSQSVLRRGLVMFVEASNHYILTALGRDAYEAHIRKIIRTLPSPGCECMPRKP